MRELTPVDLSWIEDAPVTVRTSTTLAAPPDRVFAAFADTAGWPRWFPLMTSAAWSDGQSCVGAEREVALRAFGRFRERILAFDPGRRFAFTMIGTTSPLMRRMGEDYRLSSDGAGTRFDWTMGAEPRGAAGALVPGLRVIMRRILARAARNLDGQLRA